jgi:hypothetical protein
MTSPVDAVPTGTWKDAAALQIRGGIDALLSATNDVERRSAIITWLRGADAAVEDHLDVQCIEGSPGALIAAALEDLNNGITPSLLKAKRGGTRKRVELARARARAIAGVEIVLEWGHLNGAKSRVDQAIEAVSDACGLSAGSLRSLRGHVKSRTAYRSVSVLVDLEKIKLTEYMRGLGLMGIDAARALRIALRDDRTLLRNVIIQPTL